MTAIPLLVDMAAGYCSPAAEVGRLTLLALRHHNERNADEVAACMRRRGISLDECFAHLARRGITSAAPLRCCNRLSGLIEELGDEIRAQRRALTPCLSDPCTPNRIRCAHAPATTRLLSASEGLILNEPARDACTHLPGWVLCAL